MDDCQTINLAPGPPSSACSVRRLTMGSLSPLTQVKIGRLFILNEKFVSSQTSNVHAGKQVLVCSCSGWYAGSEGLSAC